MMGSRCCPVIGIAGGIGSGKSTISGIFARRGVVIIDADRIAHQVLDSPETLAGLEREFGDEIVKQGKASRSALAAAVFADGKLLGKLVALVHPGVLAECVRVIKVSREDPECVAVVLDAPLLFEAGLEGLCEKIVFVDASRETRLKRLASSRGWDEGDLARREKFQDSLSSKKKRADYIIDNDGSIENAVAQAEEIWQRVVAD